MQPEQQDSSDLERQDGRNQCVTAKVSRTEKRALERVADARGVSVNAVIIEALAPVFELGEQLRRKLHELVEV